MDKDENVSKNVTVPKMQSTYYWQLIMTYINDELKFSPKLYAIGTLYVYDVPTIPYIPYMDT